MILSIIISFGIFLLTSCPTVYSGDSGEFATACGVLGIAHPSGYPLYVLLGKIFTLVIPFGNIAYRINLMSAFFGALTCGIVYLAVKRFSGLADKQISAGQTTPSSPAHLLTCLPALCLAFSNQLWSQSTMAEVYSLNGFFVALIIYLLLSANRYPLTATRCIILAAFLFALGLGNHHTLLLLIPGIVYLIVRSPSPQANLLGKSFATGEPTREVRSQDTKHWTLDIGHWTFFFLLGVSVYLFLIIRSQQNPIADWDNPENLTNFFKVVFRTGYGGVMNLDEKSGMLIRPMGLLFSQMADYFKNIIGSFTIFGFLLGILGFISQYKKEKKILWFLFIIFLFTGPVFIFLANKPLIEVARDQMEPFYIPSIIVFAIWLGYGVKFLAGKTFWTLIPVAGIIIFQFSSNFSRNNLRNNFLSLDTGKNILRTVAPDSLLFLDKADESVFILAYQKIIEKRKPTVNIIDCNASVFPNIYGDRYYWIKGNERRVVRYPIERKMIADFESGKKNVYYLSENPNYFSDMKFYKTGLLYSLNRKLPAVLFDDIYILREKDIRYRDKIIAYSFYVSVGNYYLETNQPVLANAMYEKAKSMLYGRANKISAELK